MQESQPLAQRTATCAASKPVDPPHIKCPLTAKGHTKKVAWSVYCPEKRPLDKACRFGVRVLRKLPHRPARLSNIGWPCWTRQMLLLQRLTTGRGGEGGMRGVWAGGTGVVGWGWGAGSYALHLLLCLDIEAQSTCRMD